MAHRIEAIVFDWAGTMVDFGCRAPVRALQEVLRAHGIAASEAEVRADMGKAKHAHIAALLAMPGIASQWQARRGRAPTPADIDLLHDEVGPLMIAAAAECAQLIPGALETYLWARSRGMKIGSNTGYTREMMDAIEPAAAAQGYMPDMIVCSGETAEGRPAPLMLWKIMAEMGVWPAASCVKVDDAPVGIVEARNAGTWAVGVAASGNGVGLDAAGLAALAPAERAARIAESSAALLAAGAHLVISSVADLPAAIAEIEAGTVVLDA
jgi:phosphonoacetaldehyde hydrolase